jgi:hypothetical protein
MARAADEQRMDASAYAFVHGIKSTRGALSEWQDRPGPVLRRWLAGSLAASVLLLAAIWIVAAVTPVSEASIRLRRPPFIVGDRADVVRILVGNLLVLALHAMACVAGFIAGSSLPLQARYQTGWRRTIHERGRPAALAFVVCATVFSLSMQAYSIGTSAAHVAFALNVSDGLLLLGLLPHALPELVALFLPLAAWIVASRRGEWDRLLAATIVTVALAVPVLVVAAVWEVYVAPRVLGSLLGYG